MSKIFEVFLQESDLCGNNTIKHWGFVESETIEELNKIFINEVFCKWIISPICLTRLPKTKISANSSIEDLSKIIEKQK